MVTRHAGFAGGMGGSPVMLVLPEEWVGHPSCWFCWRNGWVTRDAGFAGGMGESPVMLVLLEERVDKGPDLLPGTVYDIQMI